MASTRYYFPVLGGVYDKVTPFALLILRVGLGLILIPHGAQKLFGWFGGMGYVKFVELFDKLGYKPGALWLTLVALTEFGGGILLVLGLFTRFAALAVVVFMIVAVHFTSGKGFFWTAGGLEYSLLIGLVALVFLIRGGGDYSLDRKLGREL
ncbi:MAG: DoxX family protein [Alphaproteobacteria bacterium]